jgi:hypothetical protein
MAAGGASEIGLGLPIVLGNESTFGTFLTGVSGVDFFDSPTSICRFVFEHSEELRPTAI